MIHDAVEVVGNTGQFTLDTVEVRSSSLLVPTIPSTTYNLLRNGRGSRRVQQGFLPRAHPCPQHIRHLFVCARRLSGVTACAYTSSVIFVLACRNSSCTTLDVLTIGFQQGGKGAPEGVPANRLGDLRPRRRRTNAPLQGGIGTVELRPSKPGFASNLVSADCRRIAPIGVSRGLR